MQKFPSCKANYNCWAGRLFCAISPDGLIYPCAEFIGTELFKQKIDNFQIRNAFEKIPDMSKCKECYFSCYSEYNLILNNKTKSIFRICKNLMLGKWFWS